MGGLRKRVRGSESLVAASQAHPMQVKTPCDWCISDSWPVRPATASDGAATALVNLPLILAAFLTARRSGQRRWIGPEALLFPENKS
jgi:hypothetical protein